MSEISSGAKKKLVVIDGKSVFYRGYYAMPNLATADGTPTGGVFGFATMALEVIKRLKPDYVAVAWDKPKTNIRKRLEIYPEYKAGRKPAPADFYEQIPLLHELLNVFDWPLYELDDYEADDIMGTLAVQAREKGLETLLITSDLDMLQLINGNVKVYALKKGLSNIELFSPKSFEAKYGIKVEQFLDLKSLKGDSSDNIPGVPGIGEKGAVELLKEYKTLDGIYDNLPLIKESMRKKLEAGKYLAYMSKKLAAIWTDAPLKLDLDEVDGHKADPAKIAELLKKLEFRNLARQLPDIMKVDISASEAQQQAFFTADGATNEIIDSPAKLSGLNLESAKEIVVHSRAAGRQGLRPKCLIISPKPGVAYTLKLDVLGSEAVVGKLAELSSSAKLIGYDIKSTLKVMMELGVKDLPPVGHDILVAAFLLNPLRREQQFSELAGAELDYHGPSLEDIDDDEFCERGGELASIIWAIHKLQNEELKNYPKLVNVAETIDWPVIPVLAGMERLGIELDTKYMSEFGAEIDAMISKLQSKIYKEAGQEFNIDSPIQLAEVLFTDLDLPKTGIKKGKTGYSTAASELDKLRGSHPIINLISQYREVAKLKNTYVDALPKMVDENSRLHTTFNLTIARTGRLSSTDPNLQNIPVRTDLGRRIRTAFVAGEGNKLVSADYSQFELRLAAVMANDKDLIDMFNDGADIHTTTAAQVYGREPEDVTKQMRSAAKAINFGILYGMSPHGLTIATGMTREQAVNFIDKYKELRKPLFDYIEKVKEDAKKNGYVETIFGRRRPMPDIHSSNFMVRSAAERAAINMPIQGTEADIMKLAMVEVDKQLSEQHNDCSMLLQIHDSILVECPEEVADRVAELLKTIMENIYELPIRLTVDTTIGRNWGEL